ncbi:MAG: isochorismate synthase [Chlamydiia bacterium]|nr:isochorismate synthase [Chlamydiia bacterium]
MKIYWEGREGNPAPPDATFSWRPFSVHSPFAPVAEIQRITTLPPPAIATVLSEHYLPDFHGWSQKVKIALSKKLEKVVLARCHVVELKDTPDPFALLATLKAKTDNTYAFCLSQEDKAFFGVSPERLFLRQGTTLYSEALAGTRRRGKNREEDLSLQQELLASPKDLREIAPVQRFLQEILTPFCALPPLFSPLSTYQTQTVQHLYTQCFCHLKADISDQTILDHMHPTPALCGAPTKSALALIHELEPFSRGLYGGLIGWSAPHGSEWAVGIRSCFLEGKTAYVYAGTGIVEGSNPEEEWKELNLKESPFKTIFEDGLRF